MRRAGAVGCASLVMTLMIGACSTQNACTLIGGQSGITFDLSDAGPLGLNLTYETCADGVCESGPATTGQPTAHLDLDSEVHDVSITLKDPSGDVVFRSNVEPGPFSPATAEPNGKGCPPQLRTLRFSVGADGSLSSI